MRKTHVVAGAVVAALAGLLVFAHDGEGQGRRRDELIAFLEALTDNSFDRTIPPRVPSGLAVGGRIQ